MSAKKIKYNQSLQEMTTKLWHHIRISFTRLKTSNDAQDQFKNNTNNSAQKTKQSAATYKVKNYVIFALCLMEHFAWFSFLHNLAFCVILHFT